MIFESNQLYPPFSLLFHNTTAYPVPGLFNYQVYFRNFIFDETAVLYFLPQPTAQLHILNLLSPNYNKKEIEFLPQTNIFLSL